MELTILNNILNEHKLSDDEKNFIIDYHNEIKTDIENTESSWNINKLYFKNLFIFGKDNLNIINFKKGLNTICAKNNFGKTSILKIILFNIFDNLQNCGKTKYFINNLNNNEKSSTCLNFNINDKKLSIQKENKKDDKFTTELYGELNNQVIKISENNKTETNKMIQNIIGDEEIFYNLNLCSNKFSDKFIFNSTEQKTQLLRKIFKLHLYELYFKIVKKDILNKKKTIENINGSLNILNKNFENIDVQNLENKVNNNNNILEDLENKKNKIKNINKELQQNISNTNNKIKKLYKKIKYNKTDDNLISKLDKYKNYDIPVKLHNVSGNITEIKNYLDNSNLTYQKNPYKNNEKIINKIETKINLLKEKLPKYHEDVEIKNYDDIENKKFELQKLIENSSDNNIDEKIINKFNLNITSLNNTIYEIISFKNNLDIIITYSNNKSTKKTQICNEISKQKLIDKLSWLNPKSKYLKEYNNIIKLIDNKKYNELSEKIKLLTNKLKLKKEKQIKYIEQEKYNEQYIKYKKLNENEHKKLLDKIEDQKNYKLIDKYETELLNYKNKLNEIDYDLIINEYQNIKIKNNELKLKIKNYKSNSDKIETYTNELNNNNNELKLLLIYKNIVNKHGIPAKMISENISNINIFVNNFIKKFTNITVETLYENYGKKNKKGIQKSGLFINVLKNNKYFDINNLGGFESLIVNLAFKIAFNKYSLYSKSLFIIIDEEFDCIDKNNFNTKLPILLNELKKEYEKIITISHRNIEKYSDNKIIIENDGLSSKII